MDRISYQPLTERIVIWNCRKGYKSHLLPWIMYGAYIHMYVGSTKKENFALCWLIS